MSLEWDNCAPARLTGGLPSGQCAPSSEIVKIMETFYEVKPGLIEQSAIALGFFDGVHIGHQAVIKAAVAQARQLKIPAAVATFADHPRILTIGKSPELLTSRQQRFDLLAALGIDVVLALPFTEGICRMEPEEYVQKILLGCLGAKAISVGLNHRFGRDRLGDAELLSKLGRENGFTVQVTPGVYIGALEISSSRIRSALKEGNLDLAAQLLGRPYAIAGQVLHGDRRGRTMGFPTANIELCPHQLLPLSGVYAAYVQLPDKRKLPAVVNLGVRPTVNSNHQVSAEAHILHFNQDIYDAYVSVEFIKHIRAEQKFDGLDALQAQITVDCRKADQLLAAIEGKTDPHAQLPA
jgi:riboflavin kinase / FMN adenylyltransferase